MTHDQYMYGEWLQTARFYLDMARRHPRSKGYRSDYAGMSERAYLNARMFRLRLKA